MQQYCNIDRRLKIIYWKKVKKKKKNGNSTSDPIQTCRPLHRVSFNGNKLSALSSRWNANWFLSGCIWCRRSRDRVPNHMHTRAASTPSPFRSCIVCDIRCNVFDREYEPCTWREVKVRTDAPYPGIDWHDDLVSGDILTVSWFGDSYMTTEIWKLNALSFVCLPI